ncbi:MAG: glycosyltransferase [Chloroflexi bacterium]|nr:glycosyltransferase [Chloroflexota bacterium]
MTRSQFSLHPDDPVSVVLVCRNKAANLPYIIDALAKGTRKPDLVVLSDDCSTDESPAIFQEICAKNNLNCKVVLHEDNGTLFRINTMRNDGVKSCPDGLVIILDADLVPARTAVEAHYNIHLKANCRTISTGPRFEYAYPDCSGPIHYMWGHEAIGMLQASKDEPCPSWTSIPGSLMGAMKWSFEEIGWFDPAYDGNYGYDDLDFMYRAWKMGYFFAGSFEAHVIHIPHPSFPHQNDINRKRFEEKYQFTFSYPEIFKSLERRQPWHQFYQAILDHVDDPAKQKVPLQTLALDSIGGWVLLRELSKRVVRKLKRF